MVVPNVMEWRKIGSETIVTSHSNAFVIKATIRKNKEWYLEGSSSGPVSLSLLEHVAKAIWIQCISLSLKALGYLKHYEVDDFDRRMEYMYEEANNCNSSLVTYSILFCWLFTFDQGSLKESVFCLHTIIVYFTCF